jgi:hypothetical protein
VSEIASEIASALQDVAAALCYEAATRYVGTAGEQRQIAATMFHTAQKRFGGVKYDGQRIEEMDIRQLDQLWNKLIQGRGKR